MKHTAIIPYIHSMKLWKRIYSIIIVLAIPLLAMLFFSRHQSSGYVTIELISYPLIFGGATIVIIYFLKKFILEESVKDFNKGLGSWYSDILWGIFLCIIYFSLFYVFRVTLSDILTFQTNRELLGLMLDMRESPLLVILWFGPVLWIGIALFEELVRVFILSTSWKINDKIPSVILSISLTCAIFGLAHYSQGSYGMVTIGLKSIVPAVFFYFKRRVMPLVYAHVLYDGIQVAMLLITYPT